MFVFVCICFYATANIEFIFIFSVTVNRIIAKHGILFAISQFYEDDLEWNDALCGSRHFFLCQIN